MTTTLLSGHVLTVAPAAGWLWLWICDRPDGAFVYGWTRDPESAWEMAGAAVEAAGLFP